MAFIVPTNEDTKTIDYNIRFFITDNLIHPKKYEISKMLDTQQLGIIKVNLVQCMLNKRTDLYGKVTDGSFLDDGKVHLICDYYKSSIKPEDDVNKPEEKGKWYLSDVHDKLYVDGYSQTITALPDIDNATAYYEWRLFIDNIDKISELDPEYDGSPDDTFISNYNDYIFRKEQAEDEEIVPNYYLWEYFDISIDKDNNTFTIAAVNKTMVNYIVKIAIYDKDNNKLDSVEMEVSI